MTGSQPAVWISPNRMLAGAGPGLELDPGTGPDRYRRVSAWLRDAELAAAFTSFTFDPLAAGSVVVAPKRVEPIGGPPGVAMPRGRVVSDGRTEWERGFAMATDALLAGDLEKVVLARAAVYRFDSAVDPGAVLARLTGAGTYRFLVGDLVGASPELLISVEDGRLESLVLAGTATTETDLTGAALELEHRLAADSAENALRRHTTELDSEHGVHVFGDIAHLGTRFVGLTASGVGILDIVAALHPTAAVAGTPADRAMRLIRRLEPGGRGRYAGPVGWCDAHGNGEFAIALRCGLVTGDRVTLHAGGGLVRGADRDREWEETELKLGPMRRALGLQN